MSDSLSSARATTLGKEPIPVPRSWFCAECPALGKRARYREQDFVECPRKSTRQSACVDAFLERQTLNKNRGGALCTGAVDPRAGPNGPRPGVRRGGALYTGADGPRAGTGRSAAWCKARAPA
jgi:hypothetical protein